MKLNLSNELLDVDLDKTDFQTNDFLIKAEHISKTTQLHLQAHQKEYFRISLLYKGEAGDGSLSDTSTVRSPAVFLHEPAELPIYLLSADCRLISLYFTEEFLLRENLPWRKYLDRVFINQVIRLTDSQLTDFRGYMNLVIHAYQKNDSKAPAVISYLLMIIFKMLTDFTVEPDQASPVADSRLAYFQFKTLIEAHFRSRHHVQAYADHLCMTAEMLGRVVKEAVNKTPKQLIDERLIAEAKKMLAWSRISNKEIAYHLGFESDSYFNRYFKKHCQQTPAQYRQKAAQSIDDRSVRYDGYI